MIRKHLILSGDVQGGGLRYRARHAADHYRLTGWVRNLLNGDVELELQGEEADIDRFLQTLQESRYIDIRSIRAKTIPTEGHYTFEIRDDEW